jgi:hypothetical protein
MNINANINGAKYGNTVFILLFLDLKMSSQHALSEPIIAIQATIRLPLYS